MADKQPQYVYVEPESYFSKAMRKAAGIGEYAKKGADKAETKADSGEEKEAQE